MYLKRVALANIRGFDDFTLEFSGDGQPARLRTLILGRNGTGKTTLLRCIGLGLSDLSGASALVELPTGGFIRRNAKAGSIAIDLVDPSDSARLVNVQMELAREGEREYVRTAPRTLVRGLFVCGYGAGRWGFGTDQRLVQREYRVSDSIGNLFDYRTALADPELTLRRLRDHLGTAKYDAAIAGLRKALGLSDQDEIALAKGGGVEISGPGVGGRIPIQAWADGYRLTFGWMLDLYAWAIQAERVSASGNVDGILLVDEIEQHLHPSMQSAVLARLSEALPHIQLVATTHSPLVAMGAAPNDVVPLVRQDDHIVKEDVPDFRGWSAEDLLVDDRLFDTSAYAPETADELAKYERLSEVPEAERSPAQQQELRQIARRFVKQSLPDTRESDTVRDLRKLAEKHGL